MNAMKIVIAVVLGLFVALSTFYNLRFGLGMSILASVTYTLYGVAEVIISMMLGSADKPGKIVGGIAVSLLLAVSLFTAVSLKLSDAHKLEQKPKHAENKLAKTSHDIALDNLKIAQKAYKDIKAEYDSFPVGSTPANRRKDDVADAKKYMQDMQKAYEKSSAIAVQANNKIESNEAEIYRLLAKWLGGTPKGWSAAFFMVNALIIVFGFNAILYVWRHQRPGTPLCITVSPEAERTIAEARQYELELKNAARAAAIIDKANKKMKGRGAAQKIPVPELDKTPPQELQKVPTKEETQVVELDPPKTKEEDKASGNNPVAASA